METRCCCFIFLLLAVVSWVKSQDTFVIPRLRIITYTKGLKMSLNHVEGMQFVVLIANINKELTLSAKSGDISEEIELPKDNRWTVEIPDIELKVRDVINYKLAVRFNGKMHFTNLLSYTVQVLRNPMEDAIIWPGTPLSAGDTDQNRPSPITVKPATLNAQTTKPSSASSPVISGSSNINTVNRNQQQNTAQPPSNQNVGNSNRPNQVTGKPTSQNPQNLGSPKPPVVSNVQPNQQNTGLPSNSGSYKPPIQPNQQNTGVSIPPNLNSPKPPNIQPNPSQQNTGVPITPNLVSPKPPNPNQQNIGVTIPINSGSPKPPIFSNLKPNQQNTGVPIPPNLGPSKPTLQPNLNQQNIGVPVPLNPPNIGNSKPQITQHNQQNTGVPIPKPPIQPNPQNTGLPIPLNPPNSGSSKPPNVQQNMGAHISSTPLITQPNQQNTGVTNVPSNSKPPNSQNSKPSVQTSMPVRIQKPAPLKPKPIASVLAVSQPDTSGSSEGSGSCKRSNTLVRGQRVCKGALIFEDHFDFLDLKKWTYDIRIADEPDYEFCIYDKRRENAFVQEGILHLRPTLTERIHGQKFMNTGFLQLEECTGSSSAECEQQASFGYVMPAVTSSRLRSSFSFIYGRVEIRAKMASGDWLLSSLLLQPVRSNYYGTNYVAGQMRLGMARGNKDLQCDDVEYGISQVEAGVVLAVADDQIRRELSARELARGYNRDFHTYRVDWLPDKITFFIDGRIATSIIPPQDGFASLFEDSDSNPWRRGSKIAPFDREFVPALRLSAGGIHDFPDTCIGNGKPKPWKNNHPKARLYFYQNQTLWAPTWSDNLQIDYIKIWAL